MAETPEFKRESTKRDRVRKGKEESEGKMQHCIVSIVAAPLRKEWSLLLSWVPLVCD